MGKASKIARRMEKIRIKLRLRLTGETGVDGGGVGLEQDTFWETNLFAMTGGWREGKHP